jgi:hypothetical protein
LIFRGQPHQRESRSAPHSFKQVGQADTPALHVRAVGREKFFVPVGDPIESRTARPPKLSKSSRPSGGQQQRHSRQVSNRAVDMKALI